MYFKDRIKTNHYMMKKKDEFFRGQINILEHLSKERPAGKRSVIYVHIPFCTKTCSFCSLIRSQIKLPDDYYLLIIEEIEKYSNLDYIKESVFDAVYFGGGTPTVLSPEMIKKLVCKIKESFNFTNDAEFTFETSVSELTDEKIDTLFEVGVNRISVGVQTFSNRGRKLLGRKGSGEFARAKLEKLKQKDFKVVGIDIIYSYPNQTLKELDEDLKTIFELELDGFSMYSLINIGKNNLPEMNQETDFEFFTRIIESSFQNGYKMLELTKMVKKDEYKYIVNRNKGEDTLPLGAGAGGNFKNVLIMNSPDLESYKQSIKFFENRNGIVVDSIYSEFLKIRGKIQMLEIPIDNEIVRNSSKAMDYIDQLISGNLAVKKEDKVYLTINGAYWGNNIGKKLIEILQESIKL
ncbi:MAG: coproporphyrinogen-III oxidase family protein [Fervidobacterium sp.]